MSSSFQNAPSPQTMVKQLDTPVSVYAGTNSDKTKIDQKGYQPFDLVRGDILPASIFLGIAAVTLLLYIHWHKY